MVETLSDIIKKATIEFPWSLDFGQIADLFEYVENTLPGKVDYRTVPGIKKQQIRGKIFHSFEPSASYGFELKYSRKDKSKLSTLQFLLPKDFANAYYRPEVVQLWEDVKKAVEKYFEANHK